MDKPHRRQEFLAYVYAVYDSVFSAYFSTLDILDADAARYTALEDPNIIIRTWR